MQLRTHSHTQLPLALSPIAAGPAAEIGEDYALLDVNAYITNNRNCFVAYQVTGDSMVDNISAGDLIFVDTEAVPTNGSVVAASLGGLVTVKILKLATNRLYLVSANMRYKPREITHDDDFKVLGVVRYRLGSVG
jgi:SOS-response transcriptional repressor LexA